MHAIDIVKYAFSTLGKSFYDCSTKARIQETFLENNTKSTLEICANEARYDLYITFLTSRKQLEIRFRERCAYC